MTDHDDLDWLAAEQPTTSPPDERRHAARPHARCSCTPAPTGGSSPARPTRRSGRAAARERRWLRPSRVLALAGAAAVDRRRRDERPRSATRRARLGSRGSPRVEEATGRAAGAAGRAAVAQEPTPAGDATLVRRAPHVPGPGRHYARLRPLRGRRHATTTGRPMAELRAGDPQELRPGQRDGRARSRRQRRQQSGATPRTDRDAMITATWAESTNPPDEPQAAGRQPASGSAAWTRCWPAPGGPTCGRACCACSRRCPPSPPRSRRGTGAGCSRSPTPASSTSRRPRARRPSPAATSRRCIVDAESGDPGRLHGRRPRSGAERDDDLRHRAHDARARPAGIDARRHGRFTTGLGGMPRAFTRGRFG